METLTINEVAAELALLEDGDVAHILMYLDQLPPAIGQLVREQATIRGLLTRGGSQLFHFGAEASCFSNPAPALA